MAYSLNWVETVGYSFGRIKVISPSHTLNKINSRRVKDLNAWNKTVKVLGEKQENTFIILDVRKSLLRHQTPGL